MSSSSSSNNSSTTECRYAENCYRQNPEHFKQYSHKHLEDILKKGINPVTKKYNALEDPGDSAFFSEDHIVKQLDILANLNVKENVGAVSKSGLEIVKPKEIGNSSVGTECAPANGAPQNTLKQKCHTDSGPSTSKTTETPPTKKSRVNEFIPDLIPVVLPKGKAAEKLEMAAPYNFFLTAITSSPATHDEPLTITLQELLDESLGEIESSVQINFMVDIEWLLYHYFCADIINKPLLILHGSEIPDIIPITKIRSNVQAVHVQMASPFGTHHTKMMLFKYKDSSMRVVISTANLYMDDWDNRTQGLWISPRLNQLPEGSNTNAGESPTEFRSSLIQYLSFYKIPKLQPYIESFRRADFSSINVFFVASVPGGFRVTPKGFLWGHPRVEGLLKAYAPKIDNTCPVVAQSSSIGTLGPNINAWINSDIVSSFRKDSTPAGIASLPPFRMIYPSYGNVLSSHDKILGGGCLPYGKKVDDKQGWLKSYLYQWRASSRHRSKAMPHIKTYCRWSEEGLHWFILSSANLSKAAWGAFNKSSIEKTLRISNYEAGVLFLPQFVIGESTFPLHSSRDGIPPFPMPYDIPLTPYGPDDKPFVMDYLTEATT